MFNKSVSFEKQCSLCKVGAGVLFSGYGIFHQLRIQTTWHALPNSAKAFNAGALLAIYGLGLLNFYAAYEITMGKQVGLVEMRPSYSQQFTDFYSFGQMSP